MTEQAMSAGSPAASASPATRARRRPLQLLVVSYDHHLLKSLIATTGGDEAVHLCGWVSSAEELSARAGRRRPDIALIDFDMPLWASMGALEQVLGRWPGLQIMAVFSPGKTGDAIHAVLAGANACMLKDSRSPAQLSEALVGLAAGSSTISPEIARLLIRTLRRSH